MQHYYGLNAINYTLWHHLCTAGTKKILEKFWGGLKCNVNLTDQSKTEHSADLIPATVLLWYWTNRQHYYGLNTINNILWQYLCTVDSKKLAGKISGRPKICSFTHDQNFSKKWNSYFATLVYCVSVKLFDTVNSNGPNYFFAWIFMEYCLEVEKGPVKFKESCGFTHDQNFSKKWNSYFYNCGVLH